MEEVPIATAEAGIRDITAARMISAALTAIPTADTAPEETPEAEETAEAETKALHAEPDKKAACFTMKHSRFFQI